jgi:hypothetical protein
MAEKMMAVRHQPAPFDGIVVNIFIFPAFTAERETTYK